MNVTWSQEALDEVARLATRLRETAPTFETRFLERVFEAIERIAQFPESGRIVPELRHRQVREVIIRPCRPRYTIGADRIVIHAVFHGAMSLE